MSHYVTFSSLLLVRTLHTSCQHQIAHLKAIVLQSNNCPFGVNTAIAHIHINCTSDNNDIYQGAFQLTSMPILSHVVVIFVSQIVVLTPNFNFWIVPLLHSASETFLLRALTSQTLIYRVIQGQRSIFLEVTVPVIVSRKFHWNAWLIMKGYQHTAV